MRMYQIISPAIAEAKKNPVGGKPSDPSLAKYYGTYDESFGGEAAIVPWEDGLAMVFFPTGDPIQALSKLRHVSGDTFRRVREDGGLPEEIVFENNARGEVTRFKQNSNYAVKVR
jgi:hypothetical protein